MTVRLLVFQHNAESPAGLLQEEWDKLGIETTTLVGEGFIAIPNDATTHDGLVLLGGAMSANDDARCPHFPAVLNLIRAYAEAGKPVLGICLGGQLVARAFGATVHEGLAPEFGFQPLSPTVAAASDPLLADVSSTLALMQWHEDTFDIPAGAELLLTGEGCRNQAYRLGATVWGFQGHLEVTAGIVRHWAALRAQLKDDPDAPERIEVAMREHFARTEAFGRSVGRSFAAACVTAQRARAT